MRDEGCSCGENAGPASIGGGGNSRAWLLSAPADSPPVPGCGWNTVLPGPSGALGGARPDSGAGRSHASPGPGSGGGSSGTAMQLTRHALPFVRVSYSLSADQSPEKLELCQRPSIRFGATSLPVNIETNCPPQSSVIRSLSMCPPLNVSCSQVPFKSTVLPVIDNFQSASAGAPDKRCFERIRHDPSNGEAEGAATWVAGGTG